MNTQIEFETSGLTFHIIPEITESLWNSYYSDALRSPIPECFPDAEVYVATHPQKDEQWDVCDVAEQLLLKRFSSPFEAEYALCYARGIAYLKQQWELEKQILTLSADDTQETSELGQLLHDKEMVEPNVSDNLCELAMLEQISTGNIPTVQNNIMRTIGIIRGFIPSPATLRDIRLYVKTFFNPEKQSHTGRITMLAHKVFAMI